MTTINSTRPDSFAAEEGSASKTWVKRASTPRRAIKTVYWRGDVVAVVNRIIGRPLVRRDGEPGWFWTDSWQKSIQRSITEINAGKGAVHQNDQDFLTALGE